MAGRSDAARLFCMHARLKVMKDVLAGIAIMAAAVAGCASDGAASGHTHGMLVLLQGSHSGVVEQAHHDIHDQAGLQALWARVYAKDSSAPALPQIDWSKQMVLAYFMGEQNHGGYRVSISKAEEGRGVYSVQATLSVPGHACHVTKDITQPYVIVVVPASTAPVSWEESVQENLPPCG